MPGIPHIKTASITNRPSGGGNKLQGLPGGIGIPMSFSYKNIQNKSGGDKRNYFHLVNQLAGGIGRPAGVTTYQGGGLDPANQPGLGPWWSPTAPPPPPPVDPATLVNNKTIWIRLAQATQSQWWTVYTRGGDQIGADGPNDTSLVRVYDRVGGDPSLPNFYYWNESTKKFENTADHFFWLNNYDNVFDLCLNITAGVVGSAGNGSTDAGVYGQWGRVGATPNNILEISYNGVRATQEGTTPTAQETPQFPDPPPDLDPP